MSEIKLTPVPTKSHSELAQWAEQHGQAIIDSKSESAETAFTALSVNDLSLTEFCRVWTMVKSSPRKYQQPAQSVQKSVKRKVKK